MYITYRAHTTHAAPLLTPMSKRWEKQCRCRAACGPGVSAGTLLGAAATAVTDTSTAAATTSES